MVGINRHSRQFRVTAALRLLQLLAAVTVAVSLARVYSSVQHARRWLKLIPKQVKLRFLSTRCCGLRSPLGSIFFFSLLGLSFPSLRLVNSIICQDFEGQLFCKY